MARPKPELVLSDDERQPLARWAARPKSTQRLALRARIVPACVDEPSNKAVPSPTWARSRSPCRSKPPAGKSVNAAAPGL